MTPFVIDFLLEGHGDSPHGGEKITISCFLVNAMLHTFFFIIKSHQKNHYTSNTPLSPKKSNFVGRSSQNRRKIDFFDVPIYLHI